MRECILIHNGVETRVQVIGIDENIKDGDFLGALWASRDDQKEKEKE